MNLDYKYLLDGNFHPDSRVWIYQCNRVFNMSEALEIEDMLKEFVSQWQSHGAPVKGAAHLFFGRFIILIADDTMDTIGGCSTDGSMRFIKQIEQQFKVYLFDRMSLAFVIKEKVELLPLAQLQYAFDNGYINNETLYFNNLVQTKEELENNWIIPLKDSWLYKRISQNLSVL